jgi:hypothetical protein
MVGAPACSRAVSRAAISLCAGARSMQTGPCAQDLAAECRLVLVACFNEPSSGDVFGAPCPPPPCPALTRPPARCFPCALRELRGSAFPVPSPRNLPRKPSAASARKRARFLAATFPKSAARPWEQGTLASRCAGVSRVRFGQFRFGGKENGTLRKQHPA